jgi:hypothetical protein
MSRGRVVAPALLLAALYGALFVGTTWPLYRAPASTVLDTASLYGDRDFIQRDTNLSLWVLAWTSHALLHEPRNLFHGNAFHPARWSVALSEHMLGVLPLFAPVYWTTGNPVLAHQVALAGSFVLAGLAMAAYVFHWTRDHLAATTAGVFFAFAPYRFWQMGNVHVISIQYLPLVLLGIDWALGGRRRAGGMLVAAMLALSALCSYYVGYAAFVMAGAYTAMRVAARRRLAGAGAVAAGTLVAAAGVGLVSIPYVLLRAGGSIPDHGADRFAGFGFLGPVRFGVRGLLSFFVLPRNDFIPQFVGWTVIALAVVALARATRAPRGALLAVAIAGAVLYLGPVLHRPWKVPLPYWVLADVIPGWSSMRVPERFGVLVTVTAAALGGMGLATLRASPAGRGHRIVAAAAAPLAATLFLFEVAPRRLDGFPQAASLRELPPVYAWLAEHGDGGPLLELPTNRYDFYRQSVYMYRSVFHHLPLANGYTGYPPAGFGEIMDAAAVAADPAWLERLLGLVPLRWIVLHRAELPATEADALERTLRTRLQRRARFGDDVLFEVPTTEG